MPSASFTWPSFLGGEWSTYYQGRTDDARYHTAMNVCLNAYPLEEGAWTRRSGFRFCAVTRCGQYGRIYPYSFADTLPYTIEFTSGHLRLYSGGNLALEDNQNVIAISTGTPVIIQVDADAPWVTGDQIEFLITSGPSNAIGVLMNRQFSVTLISAGVYSLQDPVTGDSVVGTEVNFNTDTMVVTAARVQDYSTPYVDGTTPSGAPAINPFYLNRVIQYAGIAVVVNYFYPPYALSLLSADDGDGRFSTFSWSEISFTDGPYWDAYPGQSVSPSGQSGTITLTFTGGFGPRSACTSLDVGKLIRFFSEPLAWDGSTGYTAGQSVAYPAPSQSDTEYYTCIVGNTGENPASSPTYWTLNPSAAQWTWGTLESYVGPTQMTCALQGDLANTTNVYTWRLGLFGGVDNYAICGTFHEGRLWLATGNTLLSSQSGDPFNFAPTLPDGTVTDACAINYTLLAGTEDFNQVNWMHSDSNGIVCGTSAGEWLISASNLSDPLTPSSMQAKKVTKYGCGFIDPIKTGLSLVFVQKYGRKVMEFLADVFTGKYVAPNLTAAAKHLTTAGIQEIAYTEELTPIVWARDANGGFFGMTYRRTSAFSTEPPAFVGWHRHTLGAATGDSRKVLSVVVTPNTSGTLDTLNIMTNGEDAICHVEQSVKAFDTGDALTSAWFLDDACTPSGIADTSGSGVTLYGYWYLAGKTNVSVFIGGLDCGTYTVNSDGTITVPYGSDPDGLFTQSYLLSLPVDTSPSATSLNVISTTTPARSAASATVGSYGSETGVFIFTDWGNGRFVQIGDDSNFYTYNIETRAQIATAGISSVLPSTTLWGGIVGTDGNFYIQSGLYSNPKLYQIDPTSWTVLNSWGPAANDLTTGPIGIEYSYNMASVYASGAVIVSTGDQTSTVAVVDATNMRWIATLSGPTGHQNICRGYSGNAGSVYLCDYSSTGASTATLRVVLISATAVGFQAAYAAEHGVGAYDSSTTYAANAQVTEGGIVFTSNAGSNQGHDPIDDYNYAHWTPLTNPGAAIYTVATLAASAIDSLWTSMTVNDMGYDHSDGNLIIFATKTAGTSTHAAYLAKVSSADGTVLWTTPVSTTNSFGLSKSRISGYTLAWIDAAGLTYAINTQTGALWVTAVTTSSPTLYQGQVSDTGSTGLLLMNATYDSRTSGAATPLSGTPSTFSHLWCIYTPGTYFTPVTTSTSSGTIPVVAGYSYTSEGQMLRPGAPQEAGSANGPPMGKVRRIHQFGALVVNGITQSVTFGTDFTHGHVAVFRTPGGTPYNRQTLYTGTHWDVVEDDYGFDSMLAWQVTRPYPCVIASMAGFIETQDR